MQVMENVVVEEVLASRRCCLFVEKEKVAQQAAGAVHSLQVLESGR